MPGPVPNGEADLARPRERKGGDAQSVMRSIREGAERRPQLALDREAPVGPLKGSGQAHCCVARASGHLFGERALVDPRQGEVGGNPA